MKKYGKGGLSDQLHRANEKREDANQNRFRLKGPLGKGLGLPDTYAEGIYVAFAAGTGVLVFMDLVAHIVRKTLD